ncbi:MAG: hypothetical protein JNK82_04400 [Myxococcaceae bacterium]|nr:hypothetical protein [Myxococcaceae bacterium]
MSERDDAVAELARLGVKVTTATVPKGVEGPRVLDVLLAEACARGDGAAIALFEKTYFPHATRALAKMGLPGSLADDVVSWMRFELFARDGKPLTATYSGRGDLGSWVRSIAVHEGLKRVKKARREVDPEAVAELPVPAIELGMVSGAHGKEFTRALQETFRELSVDQRNLLRQYFLDGLTIDALAKLHAIHRSTAARRVDAARAELVEKVKGRLKVELGMSNQTVEEVITLSNLDESLGGLLRKTKR